MNNLQVRPKIGVMGSAGKGTNHADSKLLISVAERLGQVIAERGCVLVTGATTGFPDIVSRTARRHGGLSIGISPALSRAEHVSQYALPDDGVDLMVYTGFGLKGRNVVNVRTSDVVVIFGGGIGTLNEFTIAYDEGKLVGVLEGTGGVADQIREIVALSNKQGRPEIVFESSPEALIDNCLRALSGSS